MKSNKQKPLSKMTKPELIQIIRSMQKDFNELERAQIRCVRTVASYRNILMAELKSSRRYWDSIIDDMIEEEVLDDADLPPNYKIPSKKKEIEKGYS